MLTSLALLALALPAAAQEDDDPVAAADHLTVVAQTPWVPPGGTFALRLQVDDPPAGAALHVDVHRAVGSRIGFNRTLEGEGLGTRLASLDPIPVGPDGSAEVRVVTGSVTGEEPNVSGIGPDDRGVYPVVVELVDGDGDVVDELVTHLLRLPQVDPDEFPLDAAVVLPLHAPPSHVAPGEIDTGRLARLDVTADALAARPAPPLTVVPTPEAIAAATETDPAAADHLAEALATRQVVATPWVRLDVAAWRAEGLGAELADQLDRGRAALRAVTGTSPSTTTAVVPRGGGAPAVAAAVAGGASRVVVPGSDLEPLDGDRFPLTLTRPFELAVDDDGDDLVPALVADPDLAAHAGSTGDPVLDAHRLLADLAVLALDAPGFQRAAVVVLDDDAATEPAFLDALLAGLDQPARPGVALLVRPVTVDDAFADVDPAVDPGDDEELVRTFAEDRDVPSLGSLPGDLAAARADVGSYRSVFGDGDPLAAQAEVVVATAASAELDTPARRQLLADTRARLLDVLGGIHGPPRQRVTLTAREGQVQFNVGNDTDRRAEIALELRGERLEFPSYPDDRVVVALDGPTTRVDLDVRARSSGDAPLDIRLTTPDGRIELGESRITVRTTAVSGVGLVLMAAAAVFLVVWWTRTIIRDRRASRARHPAHARADGR